MAYEASMLRSARALMWLQTVRRGLALIVIAGWAFSCIPAQSQDWPARPIRVVVGQAAGSTPDILCRLVVEQVSRRLGQQIVVENRAGGGSVIAAQNVARSAADGYTFFWATAAALVTNPYTFKSLPYDPQKDFVPVAKIADGPFLLLANQSVPANSLPELIAYAKEHSEKLAFATDGPRNFSGMIAAWINKLAGTSITMIPYAAMPQGVQDTIANRVQLAVLAIPSAQPQIQSGALKALAISTPYRAPGFESIAPVADVFPGFDFGGWMALVAPAGTPAPIVQRMNAEFDAVLKEPAVTQRLRSIGFYTKGAETPPGLVAYIRAQQTGWAEVVKRIGVEPE